MRVGRKTGGENHGIDTHQVRVEYPTCLATDIVIPIGAVFIGLIVPRHRQSHANAHDGPRVGSNEHRQQQRPYDDQRSPR